MSSSGERVTWMLMVSFSVEAGLREWDLLCERRFAAKLQTFSNRRAR